MKTGVRIPVGTPSAFFTIEIVRLFSLVVPLQHPVGHIIVRRLIRSAVSSLSCPSREAGELATARASTRSDGDTVVGNVGAFRNRNESDPFP